MSLHDLLPQMTLTEIAGRAVEARREGPLPCEGVNFQTQWGAAFLPEGVAFEVLERLDLTGSDGVAIATISASVAVVFTLPESSRLEGQDEILAELAGLAHMAAHPYLRSTITALSTQIGLPVVTVGFLRAGSAHPESVTILDRVFWLDSNAPAGEE
jgi:hypothetical protein